jgi:hypothetical protein
VWLLCHPHHLGLQRRVLTHIEQVNMAATILNGIDSDLKPVRTGIWMQVTSKFRDRRALIRELPYESVLA